MKHSAKYVVVDPAMTLEQIADSLGITRAQVWLIYKSAMRKIRKQPHVTQQFRELIKFRVRMRELNNG